MNFYYQHLLGGGAAGDVWLADDLELGRLCAVKFFAKASASRQLGEASVHATYLARVDHPCVVRVYAVHEDEHPTTKRKTPIVVMEYVPGTSLAAHRGSITAEHGAAAVNDLIGAIEAIHAAGMLHGDLWAPNVILTDSGAKVIDIFYWHSPSAMSAEAAQAARADEVHDVASLARQILEYVDGVDKRALYDAYHEACKCTALDALRLALSPVLQQQQTPPGSPKADDRVAASGEPVAEMRDIEPEEDAHQTWFRLIGTLVSPTVALDEIASACHRLAWYLPTVDAVQKSAVIFAIDNLPEPQLRRLLEATSNLLEDGHDHVAQAVADLLSYGAEIPNRIEQLVRSDGLSRDAIDAGIQIIESIDEDERPDLWSIWKERKADA